MLGYEWDASPDNGFMPAGLIYLSSTTVAEPTAYNTDWGSIDTAGTATNNLIEYRDPTSGALVFGAGTVFWSWGLSNQHDNSPSPFSSQRTGPECPAVDGEPACRIWGSSRRRCRRAWSSPANRRTHTPPTSTISTVSTRNVVEGQTVTVIGTATDSGGGVIGGVQVSTDSGRPGTRRVGRSAQQA